MSETQKRLKGERGNVDRLREEAVAMEMANADARKKLQQLEAEIARLSAERSNYLKIARVSDFSLQVHAQLGFRMIDYRRAVDAAHNYLDAPRWDAEDGLLTNV